MHGFSVLRVIPPYVGLSPCARALKIFMLLGIGVLVLALRPSCPAFGQEAALRILVTSEEDGNPVAGGNVRLLRVDTGQQPRGRLRTGVTSSDGLCVFRGIAPGSYRLVISHVGHNTHERNLTIEAGALRVERVTLSVKTRQLEEVVVEEERNVTTGEAGLRRITSQDIGRIPTPGPGSDLVSYLQTLPAVEMPGNRGGSLYIRGGTPTQNQILIDNIPIVKPFHISNLFSAVPGSMVQRVDLYAGGFGAEYLGKTSAVLDIELSPGNMKEYSGNSAVSPYLFSFRVEGPVKSNRQSFVVMGRNALIQETAPYFSGEEVPLQFYDAIGRYTLRTEGLSCNFTGIHTHDSGQINPQRNLTLSWSNTAVGARCKGFGKGYRQPFDVTIGYSNFRNEEGPGGKTARSASLSKLFFKVDLEHELWGLPFNYGLDAMLPFYAATLGKRFTTLDTFGIPTESVRAHGAVEWSSSKHLTIEPSLGTQLTLRTSPTLEPRLRISYRPDGTEDQEVSLALGRYAQLMSGIRDELDAGTVFTVLKPNEGDRPMPTALHGILGYEHHVGDYFQANVEGYVKRHRNIPVPKWTPEARLAIETARAHGLSYGLDTRMEYRRSPLFLALGYGWSNVKYEAASTDLGAWIKAPVFSYFPAHDRRHKLNMVASYRLGEYTTNVRWEFGSGRPYTRVYGYDLSLVIREDNPLHTPGLAKVFYGRPYGGRLPAYHRLDVSVKRSFQLTPTVSLDAKIGAINVYNRENIFYLDIESLQRVHQTPLFPYLSMQVSFD